jgi:hypothetical protein
MAMVPPHPSLLSLLSLPPFFVISNSLKAGDTIHTTIDVPKSLLYLHS